MGVSGRPRGQPGEQGAAAVEFAIVAGLLFMLLFGIIQMGILVAQALALSNGARVAARVAAVQAVDCSEILQEAEDRAGTIALDTTSIDIDVSLPPSNLDVCADPMNAAPCLAAGTGDTVRVQLEYETSFAIPLVGSFSVVPIIREASSRCELASAGPLPIPSATATP